MKFAKRTGTLSGTVPRGQPYAFASPSFKRSLIALSLLRAAVCVYCPSYLPAAAPLVNSATPCGEARLGLASVSVRVRVKVKG